MRNNTDLKYSSNCNQTVGIDVVLALADAEDVDPTELEPQLYTVIDPAALDALFRDAQRAGTENLQVTFEYADWTVQIEGPDRVTVSERIEDTPSIPHPAQQR